MAAGAAATIKAYVKKNTIAHPSKPAVARSSTNVNNRLNS